jgi:AcrR family transcriptional regulator
MESPVILILKVFTMLTKEQKLEFTSLQIIREYLTKYPKKISVKEIAEHSGVSRAWIYKYFGSEDQQIILTAVDCVVSQLTELSVPEKNLPSKSEWLVHFVNGLENTMKEVEAYPEIFRFYLHSTVHQNQYFERFKHHEDLFLQKMAIPLLRKALKLNLAEGRAMGDMLHSLRLGVALKWLSEPDKSAAKRSRILLTIKKQVFEAIF